MNRFKDHLKTAHDYFKQLVHPGDLVIDATCGNGHDTASLLALKCTVYALDCQEDAIHSTRKRVEEEDAEGISRLHLFCQSHATFPEEIEVASVQLIVYNLGYLPGGDKTLTTKRETTLKSLCSALPLLKAGGALCITCYPGHPEGKIEEEAVLEWGTSLSSSEWTVCHHRWLNRPASPSVLLIKKLRA